jgi:hypothetical protein
MAIFIDSFQKGLDAAKRSTAAQKEINEVFTQLKEEIKGITENKIDIYRRKKKKLFKGLLEAPYIQLEEREPLAKDDELVIVARNLKADTNIEKIIARLTTSNTGYPCIIAWGKFERTCHDRESLELCLSSLLEDASTAEALATLLSLPDAPIADAPIAI